ncbi:hypothetical protein [Paenibacillus sp. FJAT-26967]|uniref:hypothetical protein n=1 Tax=Paenibacillus sp. FJAT-26967 TaxID=1729690 RepID=UPI0020A25529|nr:hypothetical protein [Paenibacillus sp. FJAT-26967]
MGRRTHWLFAGVALIGSHGLLKSAASYAAVPKIAQTVDGVRIPIIAIAEAL